MLHDIKLIKMPTTNRERNREYVKKSQEKRKASVGVEQFNKDHTAAQMKHKEKVKSQDIEKFRKEQADYMKEYMKQRRLREKEERKRANVINVSTDAKTNAINVLTDAIKARKARKELQERAIERAEETANKLKKICKDVIPKVNANKKKRRNIAARYGSI